MSEQRRENPRAREEAAAWFARLGQPVTADALNEFSDWRRHPENASAYADLDRLWARAGKLRGDPQLVRATQDAFQARSLFHRLAALLGHRGVIGGLVAAAILAAVAVSWRMTTQDYQTGVGEQRLVSLRDGSRVRLNTASDVRVRFTSGERRLSLVRGEALFEVAHDAARPFVVDAGAARIRAIGTKFDVRRDADTVSVALVQGVVRVTQPASPAAWTLAPNQKLTLRGAAPAAIAAVDTSQLTSWTTGRLVFRQTSLAAAVQEVNRYSAKKITLESPALAATRISGDFDAGDSAAFVAAATELFGLKATTGPDGSVVLSQDRSAG
ncbi:FecR family protein [Phenylobacterium sp.]|jgi:transmembrane sensor|uniref:FecR family protein n=1 Tax=Phenylobacterium sp. TaxID=1871053 RepID=UPI002E2EB1CC|nr:FecR domain-containing protein [Phenylobacterium sp.]HEX4712526.1 FecR domain-containing protein [Phenylobacterium sp.]